MAATALITTQARAHAGKRLEDRSAFYAKPKLLIVNELGYLPIEANAAHLFFQLGSRGYVEKQHVGDEQPLGRRVGAVFGDAVVAIAVLDRLLHRSQVVTIRGDIYRLRGKRRSGLLQVFGGWCRAWLVGGG